MVCVRSFFCQGWKATLPKNKFRRASSVLLIRFPLSLVFIALVLTSCASMSTKNQVGLRELSNNENALLLRAEPALKGKLQKETIIALARAEARALDFASAGEPVAWLVEGQQSGMVTASAPFRVGQSRCRRLSMTLLNGGDTAKYDLTVCKRGQSGWRLVR